MQISEIAYRPKIIYIGQCNVHPPADGLIVPCPHKKVQRDDLVSFLIQVSHLRLKNVDLPAPASIQVTKLAVLVALRMLLLVFLPQQHESDTFAAQLPMDIGIIRSRAYVG